jgi:hypothetical protein
MFIAIFGGLEASRVDGSSAARERLHGVVPAVFRLQRRWARIASVLIDCSGACSSSSPRMIHGRDGAGRLEVFDLTRTRPIEPENKAK